jgi:hypothetical protein
LQVSLSDTCKAALHVLVYLQGTLKRDTLHWNRPTTEYVVYASSGPIAWQSKLQTTIAISSIEAEYMAAFGAIQELIWTKGVFGKIGLLIR